MKQPFYFQLTDEAPFAFAGIWDDWRNDDVSIASCAIVTTAPNELLATIHDLICTNSVKSDAKLEELDIEAALNYATNALNNAELLDSVFCRSKTELSASLIS